MTEPKPLRLDVTFEPVLFPIHVESVPLERVTHKNVALWRPTPKDEHAYTLKEDIDDQCDPGS